MQTSTYRLDISARRKPDHAPLAEPLRPFLSREVGQWQRIKLQRYQFASGRLQLEYPNEHTMIFQLGGPSLLVNESDADDPLRRCWFDRSQMNLTTAGVEAILHLKGPSNLVLIRLDAGLVEEVATAVHGSNLSALGLRSCLYVADAQLRALCRLLLIEVEKDDAGSTVMIDSIGRAMALQLLRQHAGVATPESAKPAPTAGVRLRRVLEYMREHLDTALPISLLAKVAGLSPSQFIRAFRRSTGQSPHRYLVNLRLDKARELLEQTELSVLEVGLQSGFDQASHFATVFKRRMGMSPRVWRCSHRY